MSTTRIPQAEITGVYGALVKRFSKRLLGHVPEPLGVHWHNRAVLKATMGIGYYQAFNEHLDLDKAREVPRWRESRVFTPLERAVLGYAEAMTLTPPVVTDEMVAGLLDQLGNAALVELTAFIGLANMNSRGNVALGIESEGYADSCDLKPLATPALPSTA